MSAATVPRAKDPPLPTHLVDPDEILAWAYDTWGDRVALLSALGPQSCVLVERLAVLDLPVRIVLLDTGLLFPETLALADRLEAHFGRTIERIRPALDLGAQAEAHGPELWRSDPDRCCALRKVEPLGRVLDDLDAWITGLRADSAASRAETELFGWDAVNHRVKVNPLARWTRAQTLAWLVSRGIPYNPLLDRGYPSVGCVPCTRPSLPSLGERAGRWADHSSKTECGLHQRPVEKP